MTKILIPNYGRFNRININKEQLEAIKNGKDVEITQTLISHTFNKPLYISKTEVGEMYVMFENKEEAFIQYRIGEALECATDLPPYNRYDGVFVRLIDFEFVTNGTNGYDGVFKVCLITEEDAKQTHQVDPNKYESFRNKKETIVLKESQHQKEPILKDQVAITIDKEKVINDLKTIIAITTNALSENNLDRALRLYFERKSVIESLTDEQCVNYYVKG